MNQYISTVRFVGAIQLKHSSKGTPRWKFHGISRDGELLSFQTASNSSSAYSCNLNSVGKSDSLLVEFHMTKTDKLIASHWILESDFDNPYWATLLAEGEAMQRAHAAKADNQRRSIRPRSPQ